MPVRRLVQLQKSAGSILVSNKLARSAPKRVAVRVNGGLGGAAIGHESVRGRDGETMTGESASPLIQGGGPAKTQSDVRTSFSGRRIVRKGGEVVAGPGL